MKRSALPLVRGRVGPGSDVAGPGLRRAAGEELGAVGRAVVGHHPLDRDAEAGVPGQRPLEEGGGVLLASGSAGSRCRPAARRHRWPTCRMLPADARARVHGLCVLAGDAVADAVDPAELLDVQVDHLAGRGALVADHRRLGLQRRQPAEAQPAQHQPHRRARHAQLRAIAGPRHPLAPQLLDLSDALLARPCADIVGAPSCDP